MSTVGVVDGAWWPRSRDLVTELADLVEVLSIRLGSVTKAAFPLGAWDATPHAIELGGHTVHLAGFSPQDKDLIFIYGPDNQRVKLLVIPPEADAHAAHAALMRASLRTTTDGPEEILDMAGIPIQRKTEDDETRWEAEGGHFYERSSQ
jgi:hypothetical protein